MEESTSSAEWGAGALLLLRCTEGQCVHALYMHTHSACTQIHWQHVFIHFVFLHIHCKCRKAYTCLHTHGTRHSCMYTHRDKHALWIVMPSYTSCPCLSQLSVVYMRFSWSPPLAKLEWTFKKSSENHFSLYELRSDEDPSQYIYSWESIMDAWAWVWLVGVSTDLAFSHGGSMSETSKTIVKPISDVYECACGDVVGSGAG